MSEDQDPSRSKVMCLNKIRFLSDEGNGSLVHPLGQHQKFVYGKVARSLEIENISNLKNFKQINTQYNYLI